MFNRLPTLTKEDETRFWEHTQDEGEHIVWTGFKDKGGYGWVTIQKQRLSVHRVSLFLYSGKDYPDMDAGHLCELHNCVFHVEWQSFKVNRAEVHRAKTHCPYGHPYDSHNTFSNGDGKRRCRTCNKKALV